jgi:hypothetical protein
MARTGEIINAYMLLVEKPERNTPLARSRHRWKDNIKRDIKEMGWEVVD